MRIPTPLPFGLLALLAAACAEPSREVSGRVEARRVTLSAETSGRILALHVDESDAVAAGDLVAELECDLQLARLEQARAGVREAQARLDLLLAGSRK